MKKEKRREWGEGEGIYTFCRRNLHAKFSAKIFLSYEDNSTRGSNRTMANMSRPMSPKSDRPWGVGKK